MARPRPHSAKGFGWSYPETQSNIQDNLNIPICVDAISPVFMHGDRPCAFMPSLQRDHTCCILILVSSPFSSRTRTKPRRAKLVVEEMVAQRIAQDFQLVEQVQERSIRIAKTIPCRTNRNTSFDWFYFYVLLLVLSSWFELGHLQGAHRERLTMELTQRCLRTAQCSRCYAHGLQQRSSASSLDQRSPPQASHEYDRGTAQAQATTK